MEGESMGFLAVNSWKVERSDGMIYVRSLIFVSSADTFEERFRLSERTGYRSNNMLPIR